MRRRKKPQAQSGEQLPLMRWGLADVYAKARDLIALNQDEVAALAGLQRKLVGRIEKGDNSVSPANRRKVAQALGLPFEQLEVLGHRLALASAAPLTTGVSDETQRGKTSAAESAQGSLADSGRETHPATPTPKEDASMDIEDPMGLAVIALMRGFTRPQFEQIFDYATTLAKRGRHHAPKEGLTS